MHPFVFRFQRTLPSENASFEPLSCVGRSDVPGAQSCRGFDGLFDRQDDDDGPQNRRWKHGDGLERDDEDRGDDDDSKDGFRHLGQVFLVSLGKDF